MQNIFFHAIWYQASNIWPPKKESIPGQQQDSSEGAYGYQLPSASLSLPPCIAATGWSWHLSRHGNITLVWRTCSCLRSGEKRHSSVCDLYPGGMQATGLPVTNGSVETQQPCPVTCLCSETSQPCGRCHSKSMEDTVTGPRSPEAAHA